MSTLYVRLFKRFGWAVTLVAAFLGAQWLHQRQHEMEYKRVRTWGRVADASTPAHRNESVAIASAGHQSIHISQMPTPANSPIAVVASASTPAPATWSLENLLLAAAALKATPDAVENKKSLAHTKGLLDLQAEKRRIEKQVAEMRAASQYKNILAKEKLIAARDAGEQLDKMKASVAEAKRIVAEAASVEVAANAAAAELLAVKSIPESRPSDSLIHWTTFDVTTQDRPIWADQLVGITRGESAHTSSSMFLALDPTVARRVSPKSSTYRTLTAQVREILGDHGHAIVLRSDDESSGYYLAIRPDSSAEHIALFQFNESVATEMPLAKPLDGHEFITELAPRAALQFIGPSEWNQLRVSTIDPRATETVPGGIREFAFPTKSEHRPAASPRPAAEKR
jgi:hypothetical protein